MLFFLLLAAHALCDFSLQNDFIARFKNRHTEAPVTMWPYVLAAHSLMHGGAVALITDSLLLGCAEALAHAGIDFAKTEGRISFHADQGLHALCKLMWVGCLYRGVA